MKNLILQIKSFFAGWLKSRQADSRPATVTNLPAACGAPSTTLQSVPPEEDGLLQQMEAYLRMRYAFRFNRLTEATEYRRQNHPGGFITLDKRELNGLCIELREQGINCWDRDVNRFVHSNRCDLLTDSTGSRRFLCIEVQDKIDTSPVDHDQLWAYADCAWPRTEAYASGKYV